ncbi:MAG: ECF transporter S component [Anaerolineales bacterium]|nr:ECF transporter S component [Anaerolineales bacterium]MCB9128311.1 ECF transporter S component [Ardenticatenales bacterium]MCB9172124.1 ECF transporter S component [Ardenticatenales bacterium]
MADKNVRHYVLTALMIALVTVITLSLRIPVGSGYFNVSEAAIYLIAFLFGPLTGFLAAGVGTALADLSGSWANFAPLTFAAHGLQGLLAGYFALPGTTAARLRGVVAGTIAMVGIYFLGEYFGAGLGWGGPAQAVVEWVPNLLQNVGGAIVAIPLAEILRRAYPPLARYTGR